MMSGRDLLLLTYSVQDYLQGSDTDEAVAGGIVLMDFLFLARRYMRHQMGLDK